ncbi:MAG: 4-(cytidine 5'-diphospho)-2-C-methyl-D-erythritol kinase [Alphaproteobacteria bacterium]|nr:4-(cytidine 5'-diphospho)-2-C-methyl-D-erythritol kinase [Alphaproteobacteria bacterium]
MTVHEFAAAKINLFLHVLGRREDGYHDLDSLVVFASVGDEIELSPSGEHALTLDGPFAHQVPTDSTNLALTAIAALGEAVGRGDGVHIRLVKNLPVAAGLGGGSADAAAVLRGLARLWETGPSMAFPVVAQALGADVPVCLRSRAAHVSGIGEAVEALALEVPLPLVLVNCGKPLATAQVFAQSQTYGAAATPQGEVGFMDWVREQRNDLAAAAIAVVPEIEQVIRDLNDQAGCTMARMSGSGATCFGLFETMHGAEAAALAIGAAHAEWWVVAAQAR